jgi:hypothetical protein
MSIQIRRADLISERIALVEMFRRYLQPKYDLEKFEWLYFRGPYGPARAWIACDQSTGEIIGAASAFPRKVHFNGELKLGLVLGDFCVAERYRTLGISLRLQRACLAAIDEDAVDFVYDFPSPSMMAVYKRIGIPQTGSLVRWAKLLRVEPRLRTIFHSDHVARGLGFVANPLLMLLQRDGGQNGYDTIVRRDLCDDEFTDFDLQLRSRTCVRTFRSAGYLNWRYLQNPASTYEILEARRNRALIGYVVYTRDPNDANIVDLSCVEEYNVVRHLLSSAVERLRFLGASSVNLIASDVHAWSGLFRRSGFHKREDSPIVVLSRAAALFSAAEFARGWQIMGGERES